MAAMRWFIIGLALTSAAQSHALELTIDPATYLTPFQPSFRIEVGWPLSITEEIKLHFKEPKFLRTIADTSVNFDIEQLFFNPTRNLEFGILGANGEETFFGAKANQTLASQSHNEYVYIPANTEIYGLFLRIDPDLNVPHSAYAAFYIPQVAISPHSTTGDYNSDGTVDAADYVVWRDSLDQSGAGLAADGNTNGTVDIDDYYVWQSKFGTTIPGGPGTSANATIPEPATWLPLALSAVGWCFHRRNAGSRKKALLTQSSRERFFDDRRLRRRKLASQKPATIQACS